MHEEDLELALDEVRDDHGEGGLLHGREGGAAVGARGGRSRHEVGDVRVYGRVEVVADGGEEGVEDERAEVFAEVDEPPGDLGACIYYSLAGWLSLCYMLMYMLIYNGSNG